MSRLRSPEASPNSERSPSATWTDRLRKWASSVRNAVDVVRLDRLAEPYSAPFEIRFEDASYRLRRYVTESASRGAPILLVPPLMLTSEVYDISPDLSAVRRLLDAALDVYLVDFGAPEHAPAGLSRTLDDHVRAVDDAIGRVRFDTGRDVHLCGYSQGGMFAYQAAALRRSHHVASIITFGSPVDIRRALPLLGTRATEHVISLARRVVRRPLEELEGLPGALTSTAFKVLSVRREAEQLVDFVRKLHDRQALEQRERRRRYLHGEGFVAWPGPAFRKFVDEIVVHNRLLSGGFVIDGQVATLADLTCPILCFTGSTDDIARPASVRAIHRAAPEAQIFEAVVPAGHFGLVVGSRALSVSWPVTIEWIAWIEGQGERPRAIRSAAESAESGNGKPSNESFVPEFVSALRTELSASFQAQLGEWSRDLGNTVDAFRFQLPRLRRLARIAPTTRISMSATLAEQARRIPDATFFVWNGRAVSYAEANRRVDQVVRALVHIGVRRGQEVGLLMHSRPSYLSAVCALSRLGAVAVLVPATTPESLDHVLSVVEVEVMLTDPEHASQLQGFPGIRAVLGGALTPRELPSGVIDLERIDTAQVPLPDDLELDASTAEQLAMILFTFGRFDRPTAARIDNHRWACSAYGAAAAATLTSHDTVYSCLALHHAAGILVAVGGALVGGSRLALGAQPPRAATFWPEVRRAGATVVFYAGDMLRDLVRHPTASLDREGSIRLFAGSGMRTDVWEQLTRLRGRASVLEFYGSTEGNVVMANASGTKIGSVGRPLPGTAALALLEWDFAHQDFARDEEGRFVRCRPGMPGVLIARCHGPRQSAGPRTLEDVFAPGDTYFVTNDWMRQDEDGDYWFLDRLSDVVCGERGPLATIPIEDALCSIPGIHRAAVYGRGSERPTKTFWAAITLSAGIDPNDVLPQILSTLPKEWHPSELRVLDEIPLTEGYRFRKGRLRRMELDDRCFRLEHGRYRPAMEPPTR